MNRKKILGFTFITLSIMIIISNIKVTGAVVGAGSSNTPSFIAVIFLVIGLILTSHRDRNYAQEILNQRKYVNTRELKKIARNMGYSLSEGHKEGTRVYDGDTVLTVIPNHRKIRGRWTAKSILEALATGESSFRKTA